MKEVDNKMNMTCKRNGTIESGVIFIAKEDRGLRARKVNKISYV